MNISAITNNMLSSVSSTSDTSYLQKQQASIEQSIQQENSSKDDTKTKQTTPPQFDATNSTSNNI